MNRWTWMTSYLETREAGGSESTSCVMLEMLPGSHSLGGHCAKLISISSNRVENAFTHELTYSPSSGQSDKSDVRQVYRGTSQVSKTDLGDQISSWLIEGSKKNNSLERDRFWLDGDSVALIVAGRQVLGPQISFPESNQARIATLWPRPWSNSSTV